MNLIVNEHKLDRQQERAIYELTLKKQRSKKSTVSPRQVMAMQQLANELLGQRKSSLELLDCEQNHQQRVVIANELAKETNFTSFRTTICRCHSASALQSAAGERRIQLTRNEILDEDDHRVSLPLEAKLQFQSRNSSNSEVSDSSEVSEQTATLTSVTPLSVEHKELQRQSSTSTIATSTSASTSTSTSTSTSISSSNSSASSHSSSSSSTAAAIVAAKTSALDTRQHSSCNIIANSSFLSSSSSGASISDAASIKIKKLRLDQLNNELERRLHQYEYLVAQEKAILGSCNMNLFANESVNNFHLFARLDQQKTSINYNNLL